MQNEMTLSMDRSLRELRPCSNLREQTRSIPRGFRNFGDLAPLSLSTALQARPPYRFHLITHRDAEARVGRWFQPVRPPPNSYALHPKQPRQEARTRVLLVVISSPQVLRRPRQFTCSHVSAYTSRPAGPFGPSRHASVTGPTKPVAAFVVLITRGTTPLLGTDFDCLAEDTAQAPARLSTCGTLPVLSI